MKTLIMIPLFRLTFKHSCFQKDIFNLVYLSESLHLYEVADYWRAIISMNEYQKHRFTQRIISCLSNNLNGKNIAVLGFAFKKNTNDTRESPAITLVSNLVAEGAHVAIYDPKVKEDQIWGDLVNDGGDLLYLERQVKVCYSAYAACSAADAVVVVTDWDEFSNKINYSAQAIEDISNVLTEIDPNRISTSRGNRFFKSDMQTLFTNNAGFKKDYNSTVTPNLAGAAVIGAGVGGECIPRLEWARIADGMRKPRLVFDGRNILDAQKLEALGFRVEAIGKSSRANPHMENHH